MAVGLYNAPALPIQSGKRYSLQGYAKAEGLEESSAWIAFSCFDEGGAWLGNDARSAPITGTVSAWTRLHVDAVTLPAETAYCQVFAQVSAAPLDAVVWFDDVTTLVERVHLPLVQR